MRRHPLSIPLRAVSEIDLGNLLLVGGIGFFTQGSGRAKVVGGLAAAVILLVLFVGWETIRHVRFEYDLTPDTLDVASGVVSRRERSVPIRRIQTLDISQGPLARLAGVAELDIETAGGGETEASLKYVAEDEARRIQNDVQRLKRDGETGNARDGSEATETDETTGTESETAAAATSGDVLFELPLRDLLLLSVVRLNLRPLAPIALAVIGAAQVLPGRLAGVVASDPGFGVLVVALATVAASPVATFARYYDFRLTRVGDELRYERGLVNRYTGSVPLDKIQTLLVRENVLERRLGYAGLDIVTAGYAAQDATTGGNSAIPFADRETLLEFARSIGGFGFEDPEFVRPPTRARRRYVGRYALLVVGLSGVLFAANVLAGVGVTVAGVRITLPRLSAFGYWYAPLFSLPLVPVAAHLKWCNRGYTLDENHALTRNGFWSRGTEIVPYYRVQTVIETESPFQRRFGLGTVTIDTAGSHPLSLASGGARAVDLDADDAAALRETLRERFGASLRDRRERSGQGRSRAARSVN